MPAQSPFLAVSVRPTCAVPVTYGSERTLGGFAAVDAPAKPAAEATAIAAAPAKAAKTIFPLDLTRDHPLKWFRRPRSDEGRGGRFGL